MKIILLILNTIPKTINHNLDTMVTKKSSTPPPMRYLTGIALTFNQIIRDPQVLSDWAHQWRVTYNALKTVYMIVINKIPEPVYQDLYLDGIKLQRVNSHKHLGVTLTSNMKSGTHIDSAISKAITRD